MPGLFDQLVNGIIFFRLIGRQNGMLKQGFVCLSGKRDELLNG